MLMAVSLVICNSEGFHYNGSPSGCKLVGNSQPHDKEAKKRETVILGGEQKVKDHSLLG